MCFDDVCMCHCCMSVFISDSSGGKKRCTLKLVLLTGTQLSILVFLYLYLVLLQWFIKKKIKKKKKKENKWKINTHNLAYCLLFSNNPTFKTENGQSNYTNFSFINKWAERLRGFSSLREISVFDLYHVEDEFKSSVLCHFEPAGQPVATR